MNLWSSFDCRAVTGSTCCRNRPVEKHLFAANLAKCLVTLVTGYMLVRAFERKCSLGVMIEERCRPPLRRAVAACAIRLPFAFRELSSVDVVMTRGTRGRCHFEVNTLHARSWIRWPVALPACDTQMGSGERKRRLGVIKIANLQPGTGRMARGAACS